MKLREFTLNLMNKLDQIKEKIQQRLNTLLELSRREHVLNASLVREANKYLEQLDPAQQRKESSKIKVFISIEILKHALESFSETMFIWNHDNPDWLANRQDILKELESIKLGDKYRMEYLREKNEQS